MNNKIKLPDRRINSTGELSDDFWMKYNKSAYPVDPSRAFTLVTGSQGREKFQEAFKDLVNALDKKKYNRRKLK